MYLLLILIAYKEFTDQEVHLIGITIPASLIGHDRAIAFPVWQFKVACPVFSAPIG